MKLKDEVIKLLEESRSHTSASDAIRSADKTGGIDMKNMVKIVCLILDYLESKK